MQDFPVHNIMKLMVLLILLTITTFSCTYIHALTIVLYLHTVEYLVYSLNSKYIVTAITKIPAVMYACTLCHDVKLIVVIQPHTFLEWVHTCKVTAYRSTVL